MTYWTRTLSSLRRFGHRHRKVPPPFKSDWDALGKDLYMAKHKSYSPLDDHGIKCSTSNALNVYKADVIKFAAHLTFLSICNGCSVVTGDAYSSEHLVPSNLALAYFLLVETNPFPELVVIFSALLTSNIPRYFLDFACKLYRRRRMDLDINTYIAFILSRS